MTYFVNFLAAFEGDDSGNPGDTPPVNPGGEPNAGANAGKSFTEEDVNRIVQERLAKDRKNRDETYKKQVTDLETKYEELLQNKSLESKDREKLEAQLEDLRKQHRTKEQQLAYEKKQAEEEWQSKYEEVFKQAKSWEERYTESTIERALYDAAVEHDAWKPKQILVQLRGQTALKEQVDSNGKPTGRLVPMVEMTVHNADSGVSEQLQMTPGEAVEYMKKNPEEWGNMFKNNIREGIGSNSATGGAMAGDGTIDHTKLTDEQYFKLRKENPAALGINPTRQ